MRLPGFVRTPGMALVLAPAFVVLFDIGVEAVAQESTAGSRIDTASQVSPRDFDNRNHERIFSQLKGY